MRKLLLSCFALVAILMFTACSTETDERSLSNFIEAFEKAGVEVDPNEKPAFEMLQAQDGVIFYQDNLPVKLYEFKSEKDMEKSLEEFKFTSWPTNGKFAIETNSDQAKKIFADVK